LSLISKGKSLRRNGEKKKRLNKSPKEVLQIEKKTAETNNLSSQLLHTIEKEIKAKKFTGKV
jgi:hypothetical protein